MIIGYIYIILMHYIIQCHIYYPYKQPYKTGKSIIPNDTTGETEAGATQQSWNLIPGVYTKLSQPWPYLGPDNSLLRSVLRIIRCPAVSLTPTH